MTARRTPAMTALFGVAVALSLGTAHWLAYISGGAPDLFMGAAAGSLLVGLSAGFLLTQVGARNGGVAGFRQVLLVPAGLWWGITGWIGAVIGTNVIALVPAAAETRQAELFPSMIAHAVGLGLGAAVTHLVVAWPGVRHVAPGRLTELVVSGAFTWAGGGAAAAVIAYTIFWTLLDVPDPPNSFVQTYATGWLAGGAFAGIFAGYMTLRQLAQLARSQPTATRVASGAQVFRVVISAGASSDAVWQVDTYHHRGDRALPVRARGNLGIDLDGLARREHDEHGYGELLGRSLFQEAVRDAFVQARANAAGAAQLETAADGRLHVSLSVEDERLRTLRWERLCAPWDNSAPRPRRLANGGLVADPRADRWDFLCLDQRTPYSIAVESGVDPQYAVIGRREMRALVLVAPPREGDADWPQLTPFDGASMVRGVRAALGEIPSDVLAPRRLVADAIGPPTIDALCERLTAGTYTLLHIVAHGRLVPAVNDTVLYLVDESGQVKPVTAGTLVDRLGRIRGALGLPRMVFLAACESAAARAEGGMGGLAQRLVRELGVLSVVAMTAPVSVTTANTLAEGFYASLRRHGYPDRALVEATATLSGRSDATVPALFSQLTGGGLFSDESDALAGGS